MARRKKPQRKKLKTIPKNKEEKQFKIDLIDKIIAALVAIEAVLVSAFGAEAWHAPMVFSVFLCLCLILFDVFRHTSFKWRWHYFTALAIVFFIACGIWEIQNRNRPRPDISLRVVDPKAIAIVVINESRVLIRDARYTLVVWNLDSDRVDSLPIIDRTAEWIRPGEYILPETFIASPPVAPLIKNGDRLLGIADVSCPDCIKTRSYWVYAIHGQGGWFAESPRGKYPSPIMAARLIQTIRMNPESFLRDIPQSARVPIAIYPIGL